MPGEGVVGTLRFDEATRLRLECGPDWSSPEWYVVQLQYDRKWKTTGEDWSMVAQFDHGVGHDVFQEGYHIDVKTADGRRLHVPLDWPVHGTVNEAFDFCQELLADERNRTYLVGVYFGRTELFDPAKLDR